MTSHSGERKVVTWTCSSGWSSSTSKRTSWTFLRSCQLRVIYLFSSRHLENVLHRFLRVLVFRPPSTPVFRGCDYSWRLHSNRYWVASSQDGGNLNPLTFHAAFTSLHFTCRRRSTPFSVRRHAAGKLKDLTVKKKTSECSRSNAGLSNWDFSCCMLNCIGSEQEIIYNHPHTHTWSGVATISVCQSKRGRGYCICQLKLKGHGYCICQSN